jgi:hypothetical protein
VQRLQADSCLQALVDCAWPQGSGAAELCLTVIADSAQSFARLSGGEIASLSPDHDECASLRALLRMAAATFEADAAPETLALRWQNVGSHWHQWCAPSGAPFTCAATNPQQQLAIAMVGNDSSRVAASVLPQVLQQLGGVQDDDLFGEDGPFSGLDISLEELLGRC